MSKAFKATTSAYMGPSDHVLHKLTPAYFPLHKHPRPFNGPWPLSGDVFKNLVYTFHTCQSWPNYSGVTGANHTLYFLLLWLTYAFCSLKYTQHVELISMNWQITSPTCCSAVMNHFFAKFYAQCPQLFSRHWFHSATRWDSPCWKMECLGNLVIPLHLDHGLPHQETMVHQDWKSNCLHSSTSGLCVEPNTLHSFNSLTSPPSTPIIPYLRSLTTPL